MIQSDDDFLMVEKSTSITGHRPLSGNWGRECGFGYYDESYGNNDFNSSYNYGNRHKNKTSDEESQLTNILEEEITEEARQDVAQLFNTQNIDLLELKKAAKACKERLNKKKLENEIKEINKNSEQGDEIDLLDNFMATLQQFKEDLIGAKFQYVSKIYGAKKSQVLIRILIDFGHIRFDMDGVCEIFNDPVNLEDVATNVKKTYYELYLKYS